jgi:hypothetical protein
MYVIKTSGKKGVLFLADRNKTQKYWWTYALHLVMKFTSLWEADKVARKYKFNDPTVITYDEACRIRRGIERDHIDNYNPEDDMHPLDSYSLGQD